MGRIAALGLAVLLAFIQAPVNAKTLPVPAGLEEPVAFWTRVYTEVGTDGGLIHDSRHLGVVYETVQFPDDVRTRRQRQDYVDRIKARYRDILTQLADGKREGLTETQQRVLAMWPDDVTDATLRRARQHIRFQLGQRDKFRRGLVRSGAWEPHIRRTLKEMGLPEALAALPHVESSFNPRARSRVGAAGLWQFTRATGRRFMRIDYIVDERMDPFFSSLAAARLLEHNHGVLGSWPLAVTAYNHGAAGMRRAVNQVGSDDIADIVAHYDSPSFGFASRNFYAAFLAAVEVDFNSEAYFGDLQRDKPVTTATLQVPAYVHARDLAEALSVDLDSLKRYNPALQRAVWRGDKLVPKGFELRVPKAARTGKPAMLMANLEPDQRYSGQIPDRFHTVRRGQTLSRIAARYGVRTAELVALNDLGSRNMIRIGQKLRLPGDEPAKTVQVATAEPRAPEPMPEDGRYEVQRGDSLWEIAQRFDLPMHELASLNEMEDRSHLRAGQTLRLRPSERAADPAPMADAGPILATAAIADLDFAAAQLREAELQPSDDSAMQADKHNAMPVQAQPQLSADPADYEVAADGTVEIQAAETLGHYADWLEIRTQRLREINGMRFGKPVVVGNRLKLNFTEVSRAMFVERRSAYHRQLQNRFFQAYRIAGSEPYRIERGDSLWLLARRAENVPMWLLRQYNPDLDSTTLRPGTEVTLPEVRQRDVTGGDDTQASVQQAALDP